MRSEEVGFSYGKCLGQRLQEGVTPSTPNADCIPESLCYFVGYEEDPISLPRVTKGVSKAVPVKSAKTKESAGEPTGPYQLPPRLLQPMNNSSIDEPFARINL